MDGGSEEAEGKREEREENRVTDQLFKMPEKTS